MTTFMPILFLLGVVVLPALIVGVAVILWGRRGRRIDDHPVCRRCRFDLSGLAAVTSGACSECGANLAAPRAVRRGNRRTDRLAVTVGASVLLSGLAAAVWAGSVWSRQVDWLSMTPTWLLVSRIGGVEAKEADLRELAARARAGKLNSESTDRVVALALRKQADPSITWHSGWGELIEHGIRSGRVSGTTLERFAKDAIEARMTVGVEPWTDHNWLVNCKLKLTAGRAGRSLTLIIRPRVHEVLVNDEPQQVITLPGEATIPPGQSVELDTVALAAVRVPLSCRVRCTFAVCVTDSDGASDIRRPKRPIVEWTEELECRLPVKGG